MIIIPWTQVGKERLTPICDDLSSLGSPDMLGEDWPKIARFEEAISLFEQHESRAAMDANFNILGGFGFRSNLEKTEIWLYYFLLPKSQGKGLGALLLSKALEHASLNKKNKLVYARCSKSNLRSIHAMEAAGFIECLDMRKAEHLIFSRQLDLWS